MFSTCLIIALLLDILFFFEVRVTQKETSSYIYYLLWSYSLSSIVKVVKQIALSQGLGLTVFPYASVYLQVSGIKCLTVGRSLFTERTSTRNEICFTIREEESQFAKTTCLPSGFWSLSMVMSLETHPFHYILESYLQSLSNAIHQ